MFHKKVKNTLRLKNPFGGRWSRWWWFCDGGISWKVVSVVIRFGCRGVRRWSSVVVGSVAAGFTTWWWCFCGGGRCDGELRCGLEMMVVERWRGDGIDGSGLEVMWWSNDVGGSELKKRRNFEVDAAENFKEYMLRDTTAG
nr:hypothetical protein [Tanacetum cinerariifolium]